MQETTYGRLRIEMLKGGLIDGIIEPHSSQDSRKCVGTSWENLWTLVELAHLIVVCKQGKSMLATFEGVWKYASVVNE